ncbi:MAG: diphthamide biosynthesis enzyme Dph2 [Halobacteriota archaeon]|nr:diphthamide biosynthesis enzyme Dph2 [Halobacteriota archaeon]
MSKRLQSDEDHEDLWNIDINDLINKVKRRNARSVGLQFPAGLKHLFSIATEIEDQTGAEVIISGRSSYGACDIDEDLKGSVDILFHFGHSEITPDEKIEFVEVRSNIDVSSVIKEAIGLIREESHIIGLITTVQHVHDLLKAKKILEDAGKIVAIGDGDYRTKYPGQVLGCNFTSARVDCDELLFIGSGEFHPVGASIATGKRVVIADPLAGEVRISDPERMMKKRYARIGSVLDARSFGILICSKEGQKRMELAKELKIKGIAKGKEVFMILMDEFESDQLLSFNVDFFVSTACPRIAIDDISRFNKAILTPIELEVVLGLREWDDIVFDEILS